MFLCLIPSERQNTYQQLLRCLRLLELLTGVNMQPAAGGEWT